MARVHKATNCRILVRWLAGEPAVDVNDHVRHAVHVEAQPAVDREAVRNRLGNQQLNALAEAFMEELRSEAIIEEP